MIVLGIDPGLALVGYGVIEYDGNRLKALEYGCITTPAHTPIDDRLHTIYKEMCALIEQYHPDEMAFEELFFNQNKTTGILVAQARGVQILAGAVNGIDIYEYKPSQIKQAITSYGKANKLQMQQSIQMLMHLPELPKPDDAADGLAVAVTHCFGQRFKDQHRMR